MTQTITALFDRPAEAQAAQAKLVAAGIPQSAIKLVQGAQTARTSGSYDYRKDEGGFWGSLKDFFMPEEDRYAYSEGLSRGGTLLTASVEPAQTETAYDILEQNGSVDLDQRETTWRKEGWSGYSATGGATAAGSTTGTTATGTTATGATALKGAGTTTGERIIFRSWRSGSTSASAWPRAAGCGFAPSSSRSRSRSRSPCATRPCTSTGARSTGR